MVDGVIILYKIKVVKCFFVFSRFLYVLHKLSLYFQAKQVCFMANPGHSNGRGFAYFSTALLLRIRVLYAKSTSCPLNER